MFTFRIALVTCTASLLLCSCVERKEHLKISPTGSVLYQVTHRADSLEDLYDGDALPRIAGGWLADQKEEVDNEGKVTYSLIAEASFPPRSRLPENFAINGDADADLYLQFPTTLKMERREDGTYYHFARRYPARQWAQIAMLRDRLVDKPLADLEGVEPKDWTSDQRSTVVRALASFETEKALVFARESFLHVTPDAPQDGWLLVRSQMLDCLNSLDYATLSNLLEPKETQEERAAAERTIEAESKRFRDLLQEHLKQAVQDFAGYNGAQASSFMAEVDRRAKAFAVTEDLGDEQFEIKVDMPGVIVASNADRIDGAAATWAFDGQIIRDREIELMVTSKVPRRSSQRKLSQAPD